MVCLDIPVCKTSEYSGLKRRRLVALLSPGMVGTKEFDYNLELVYTVSGVSVSG